MRDLPLSLPRSTRRSLALAATLAAAALASPRALVAQNDAASPIVAVRRDTMAIRRGPETTAAFGRTNVMRLDLALAPYGVKMENLSSADRDRLYDTFSELLPGERPSRYRMNATQAKALVYVVLGSPEHYRGDDESDDRGRGRDRDADPRRGPPRTEPSSRGASVVGQTADHLRLTLEPLRQSSRRRLGHDAEFAAMDTVVKDARQIVVVAEGQRCDAAADAAEDLLTASREAREKVRASIVSAWMAVGDAGLQRLGDMTDDVELKLLRCSRGR